MSALELLRWQWEGYPRYHRSRFNLLLHIVAVPIFLVGNIALLGALFSGRGPVESSQLSHGSFGCAPGPRSSSRAGTTRALYEPDQCGVENLPGAVGNVSTVRIFRGLVSCSASAISALTPASRRRRKRRAREAERFRAHQNPQQANYG